VDRNYLLSTRNFQS